MATLSASPAQLRPQQQRARVAAPAAAAPTRRSCRAAASLQQPASQQQALQQQQQAASLSRRSLLALPAAAAAVAALAGAAPAQAFVQPPPGYRYHQDKLDGYSFFFPEDWQPVTTSGNDVFYRNPFNVEENVFVNVSSPSSSKYDSVADLGSPEEAAERLKQQFLEEFMSTRLGVRRTAEVVSAVPREGPGGRTYYDIQTRVKSFASRNQLAVTQAEINEGVVLEWDRRYTTVLGVAGKRLYELRLQSSNEAYERDADRLLTIATSFECREVQA
ncbi:hypothetical protein COHA_002234 [Chlorella ohadii]|uniref:PsbP C-terminal domain-containing protein n=1 Tax=Chlorella ohadii TaxID=2649997 RepID=A0AAD5DXA9_9CHLO|nr:hypothetical protein COHA_002234 [Chlorella ohadii]